MENPEQLRMWCVAQAAKMDLDRNACIPATTEEIIEAAKKLEAYVTGNEKEHIPCVK